MLGARLLTKVYIFVILVVAVTALIIDLIVERKITSDTLSEVRQSLEDKARLIMPRLEEAVLEGGEEQLLSALRQVEKDSNLAVTYFSLNGQVVFDSANTAEHYDTMSQRPEVTQLLNKGTAYLIRHSPHHSTQVMFLGKTVMRSGLNFGYVRFAHPLYAMEKRLLDVRWSTILGAALAALLSLIPGFLFSTHLTRSIGWMRENIRGFSSGAQPLHFTRKDELGQLARDLQSHFAVVEERLAELRSQSNQFASILGGMVEGVIAVDESENVLYINSFATAILGADRTQSEGKPIWEVTRRASISDAILAALNKESTSTSEARLVDERGDRFIKIYTSTIPGDDGQSAGAVVVLQDVTTLRKLADFRQDMITNVSHEFKTPLTAIMGIAETMLEIPDLDAKKRQSFLQRIMNQADRLKTLATDVLELSRVESSSERASHVVQDIRPIIRSAFDSLIAAAELREIEMHYEEDPAPVMVNCEKESILQIADNLLDNAIKYSNDTGSIWLRITREGNQAVIEVRDNGPGIEPTERSRIFERFYRTQSARTPKTEGTGLGLAIIRSIVLSYDGDISVESNPGEGSTFTVRLPLYRTVV